MDKKLANAAFIALRDGQWDQALDHYHQLLRGQPNDGNLACLMADLLVRQGKLIEALQAYRFASHLLRKEDAPAKLEAVRKKMLRLDPDSVDEPITPVPTPAPLDATTQKTVNELKKALSGESKKVEAFQKLGDLLAKAGHTVEAVEQFLALGNALFNARQFKAAGPVFQRILELDPNHLTSRVALGEIYAKDGADSDAKKEFLFVAEFYIRQNNLERALIFGQKALQLKSIEAHYYLGLLFLVKKQLEEARKEFETLLKFKVNHQAGLTQLARLAGQEGKHEEALGYYERLVKIDPKNPEAWQRFGEVALLLGQTDAAKEKFYLAMDHYAEGEEWEQTTVCAQQALKLDPSQHEWYLKMADAAYNAGLESQAADACLALADILEQEGKNEEAEKMRNQAKQLMGGAPAARPAVPARTAEPEDPQILINLAETYLKQGQFDEAIGLYQKLLKQDPNDEKVKSALKRAYAKFAGVDPAAAAPPTRPGKGGDARPTGADEFMTVTVAEIYTKQGLMQEALKIYEKILELEPGNQEARQKLDQLKQRMASGPAAPTPEPTLDPNTGLPPLEPPAPGPKGPKDDPPPAGGSKRGRVSYV